ncbi:hypothetical protein JHK82_012152 [Glycine max]|nr:hypothetical protein JHK85_012480 [Glycine max]KAG5057154.1 hypothetical protein JHK86_012150 [Glycine max]KAG5154183.1 hypothetical protein JHK82_012152 [Glycine max]
MGAKLEHVNVQSHQAYPAEASGGIPLSPVPQQPLAEPFNAEPPRAALVASYVTPSDFFYNRNHGPIPIVEDINRYSVTVSGLVERPKQLFMKDIWIRHDSKVKVESIVKMLPKYSVTATLQCAGNRRTAMSKIKTVKGVGWDVSAIGNGSLSSGMRRGEGMPTSIWGGAKLSDVLELVGIPKLTSVTRFGGRHVEFISVDKCKEENGGPYKASIPLSQATNPEADVLLAYEMNGEPLNRDHGYPLRVVVPSVIGARSVKWLEDINIIAEECQGLFMQKDYKMFPPSVNWDNIDWSTRRPQMDFPVQCVICSLEDVSTVKPGKVDSTANVQLEKVEDIWNLRGILNTSWHRVKVQASHSNL